MDSVKNFSCCVMDLSSDKLNIWKCAMDLCFKLKTAIQNIDRYNYCKLFSPVFHCFSCLIYACWEYIFYFHRFFMSIVLHIWVVLGKRQWVQFSLISQKCKKFICPIFIDFRHLPRLTRKCALSPFCKIWFVFFSICNIEQDWTEIK